MDHPSKPRKPPQGFGVKESLKQNEITRVTILDSENGNSEEEKILAQITKDKIKNNQQADNKPAEIVFDSDAIAKIVQQSISTALKDAEAKREEALKKQQEAFEKQIEQIQNNHQEQLKSATQVLEETKQQLESQKETVQKFEGLFKLTGSHLPPEAQKKMNFPYVNTETTTDSDKFEGEFGECIELIDQEFRAGRVTQKMTEKGSKFFDFDKRPLDEYVRKNQRKVINSIDKWGKKQGWFRASSPLLFNNGIPQSITQAATTKTDLPGGFLETLSAIIRVWHRPGFIWHQFPQYAFNFTAGMGTNILVPRFALPTSSDTMSDYELSGSGTYSTLTSDRDGVSTSTVPAEVREYGRGKQGASTAINPFMTPKFTEYYSAYNLIEAMNNYLGIDYRRFEDKKLRSLIDATSRVIYNDGNGTLATAASSLNTGDDGRFTKQFLRELQVYFHIQLIEPLQDGCWILALNPRALAQLKDSYDDRWEANTTRDLFELLDVLNPTFTVDPNDWRVNGYIGKVEKFHIFEANSWGTGASGTDGVQTETLGGSIGNKVTRTSYAFGAGCTGRGISMPFEIRMEEGIDFGRADSYTWLSWEAFVALDVDPTGYSNASQQLRAVEIHTLDAAI